MSRAVYSLAGTLLMPPRVLWQLNLTPPLGIGINITPIFWGGNRAWEEVKRLPLFTKQEFSPGQSDPKPKLSMTQLYCLLDETTREK